MNLTEWARRQGIHPQTAYRWFREGRLPVPAVRVNQRTVLVAPNAATSAPAAALGLYARVSSHDQRSDLDRQLARLAEWAAKAGQPVVRVEAEVGSGMNGARSKLRRLLADPEVTVLVVEQDVQTALEQAHYGYVLETGKIVLGGKPDELWGNEAIRAAYLGGHAKASA